MEFTNLRRKYHTQVFTNAIFLLMINATLIGVGCKGSSENQPPQSANQAVENAKDQNPRISYQIVEEWNIPNGGYGRVIVIDSKYRNENGLLKLAKQLKKTTRQDRNAFIFIYDDMVAASMRKLALQERLSKENLALHDSHFIGSYFRNANTGYHAITITLKGVMGPAKEISL